MVHVIDGLCAKQPAWPVVLDRIKAIPKVRTVKDRLIYIICDSRAALANTNASRLLWPDNESFSGVLRLALNTAHIKNEDWVLTKSDPSIDDYVNASSKPSFLNHVQTIIYKINPYDLRKEMQPLVIMHLSGMAPAAKIRIKLKSSFKLEPLMRLLEDPQADKLRAACETVLKHNADPYVVAKQSGVDSFDILYLVSSARKLSVV